MGRVSAMVLFALVAGCHPECPEQIPVELGTYEIVSDDANLQEGTLIYSGDSIVITYRAADGSLWRIEYRR